MKYKLVAVDMDGTLLTPELEISKETVETINKVIEKGVIFTLSTGRMYLAAIPFANRSCNTSNNRGFCLSFRGFNY